MAERIDFKKILENWRDPTEEEIARSREFDEQQRLFKRKSQIDTLNLPITAADHHRLLHGTLDRSVKSFAAVEAWLATDVPWLLLTGSVGRGKTVAAGWALVERGGAYVGARELERVATARYGDESEKFAGLLEKYTLAVDDIGRERDAGHMTAALLDLLDERRKRGQKTIAISNVSKGDFLRTYRDERLLSRLLEPGIAMWVSDHGDDLRKAKP
jgi:DNA replication protein DnaC